MNKKPNFQNMILDLRNCGAFKNRAQLGVELDCSEQHIRNMEKVDIRVNYDLGCRIIELHHKHCSDPGIPADFAEYQTEDR